MPYTALPAEADVKAAIARELLNLAGAKELILFQTNLSPKTDDLDIATIYGSVNTTVGGARAATARAWRSSASRRTCVRSATCTPTRPSRPASR